MQTVAACVMAVVAVTGVAGCAENRTGAAPEAGDCTTQVRLDGVIYSGYGSTDRRATKYSTADLADCDDMALDASGSVFSDDPRQVTVSTFPGYPPDQVLGVRFDKDSLEVFVAESMSARETDRLLDELRRPSRSR